MQLLVLIVNLVFYLAFPLHDGAILHKDSMSYVTMDISREPLYPLFLALLRRLFGVESATNEQGSIVGLDGYLFAAVLIQAVAAAFAAFCVFRLFRSFGKTKRQGWLLGLAANACIWAPELLNRFYAARASGYTESIMTEGLGIPFFLLFMVELFNVFRDHRKRDFVLLLVLMFLCVSLRKQLAVTVLTFGAAAFFGDLIGRRRAGRFLAAVIGAVLVLAGSALFDCTYNYFVHGAFAQHTGNAMGIDCVLLYTADESDAALFPEGELRDLFVSMEAEMKERQLRMVDVPADADWMARTDHFADSYDVIGYDVLNQAMFDYMTSHPELGDSTVQWFGGIDRMEVQLRNCLLRQNPSRFLSLWRMEAAEGLVNTILRKSVRFAYAAIALYTLYLLLMLALLFRRRRLMKGNQIAPEALAVSDTLRMAALLLLAIVINTLVVSALIFPQTRYMIYGMGLFYAVLFLMLVKMFRG